MNNTPSVYVPIQPEGNGITVPMLLSLLAHGIVVGLLIYTYQTTTIETGSSIETVMVSPEALAEMQGQILANRAALSDAESSNTELSNAASSDSAASGSPTPTDSSTSQQVPVLIRSDDTPDEPILITQEHQQRLAEQSQDYQNHVDESTSQQEREAIAKLEQVEQDKQRAISEERATLDEFRDKQNNPPKIERPTANQRNIEITTDSSGSAGKNYDLSDGQSTAPAASNSGARTPSSRSSGSGASRSAGEFKKGIADKIERNLKAPTETQGLTAQVRLKLDARGNVKSAKASGSNAKVNEAAENAAYSASPLPIDFDNAANFSDLIVNVTVK